MAFYLLAGCCFFALMLYAGRVLGILVFPVCQDCELIKIMRQSAIENETVLIEAYKILNKPIPKNLTLASKKRKFKVNPGAL